MLLFTVLISQSAVEKAEVNHNHVSSKMDIVMFFDPNCYFCLISLPDVIQFSVVENLPMVLIVRNTPEQVSKTDSISRLLRIPYLIDEGQWESAEVQATPTIGIYDEQREHLYVIAEGYVPADTLIQRYHQVLKLMNTVSP